MRYPVRLRSPFAPPTIFNRPKLEVQMASAKERKVRQVIKSFRKKKMSKYNINPDLDEKLRISLAHQGEFLEDISLVYALQSFPLIASKQMFFVDIDGHKTVPVFTTEEDLKIFQQSLENVETEWEPHMLLEILTAIAPTELEAIAFNPKLAKDKNNGNTAYFDKNSLGNFLGVYTSVLNIMLDPENVKSDKMVRTYLVPAFLWKDDEDKIHRGFANLTAKNGDAFVPVFDNLNSFAKWYNTEYFVRPFKENNGQILPLTLKELRHPEEGENIFATTLGVTVNPLDVTTEDYEQTIISWKEID